MKLLSYASTLALLLLLLLSFKGYGQKTTTNTTLIPVGENPKTVHCQKPVLVSGLCEGAGTTSTLNWSSTNPNESYIVIFGYSGGTTDNFVTRTGAVSISYLASKVSFSAYNSGNTPYYLIIIPRHSCHGQNEIMNHSLILQYQTCYSYGRTQQTSSGPDPLPVSGFATIDNSGDNYPIWDDFVLPYLAGISKSPTSVHPSNTTANLQCLPNPFQNHLTLSIDNPTNTKITIDIYNVTGQLVGSIANHKPITKGLHYFNYNASALAKGVYYCVWQTDNGDLGNVKVVKTE